MSRILFLLALALPLATLAQQSPAAAPSQSTDLASPPTVDPATAATHQIQRVPWIYPAIAQAAHVQGDVVIRLTIDPSGRVSATKVLSGPPLLRQAAIDALKQWTYKPFEVNGAPATVITDATVKFELSNGKTFDAEEKVANQYFPQEALCRDALNAHDYDMAAPACSKALAIAQQFPAGTRAMERIGAWQLSGASLLHQKKFAEALAAFQQEVAFADQSLTKSDIERAYAYRDRALAYALLGDTAHADADYKVAEETARAAILALPDMRTRYSQSLAQMLQMHASLLRQTGNAAEADALDAEAAKLK
jgi:TonB family protein